jgi:signal transduction histidine kinase
MSRIISIARALSLRTLLFALVGAMGAMLTITLALNATSAWRAGALATLTFRSNTTADLLLSAAAHWAVERGITNGALSAEPSLKAEARSQIDERRKNADAALTEAAARLEDDKSPAVQALLREADGVLRDIDQLRRRVDAEVSKPRSERDAKLRAEWFPAMTKLIEVSQRLRLAAEINSESVETHLQTLQQLKHLAWVMAEHAGRERGMLNGIIQAGAPLRGEQLLALGVARGNVEYAWEIVQAITAKPGAAPSLVTATQTIRDVMFGRFQQDRDAVYKAGLAGEPYPLSAQDWFDHSTEAIDSILRLGEATTESTNQFANEMEARSRLNLAIDLMVLTGAVLLTGIAVWSTSARIARPLQEMTIVMGRLAHGETTISVPAQDRNDEIGEMAQAVEVFRRNAIRICELDAEKMADQARKEARAEEALREAQMELARVARLTSMGQLTASIAHEINHPIGATILNAQAALLWLNRDAPNLDEARQQLSKIVNDGRRAANVVSRISNLVKKAPLRMEALHVNEAIGEVIELTRGEAMKNRISVRAQFGSLPAAKADRTQVQQVILNLILNAVQAMCEGDPTLRELWISTSANESDCVLVSVRDSGPGIRPQSIERLFEPFYTTKQAGMGMGLAICRSIVEGHGGRIWATANVPRGAAFHFTLPAASDWIPA